jgi:signal transduction histidine kinase/DNA-binding response OmpR family regulator/ligand-binding sensor domain-containing protein
MNEAGFDSGWLENAKGEILTCQKNTDVMYAGGYISNLVHIEIDTLNSGNYQLHFLSNNSWSYNNWGDSPPDYPDLWGIQILELPNDSKNVNEILKNIKTSTLEYAANSIIQDQLTGNLYVGSNCKIFTFNRGKQYLSDENKISKLNSINGDIRSLYQSKNGDLWIAHSMGLTKLNLTNNNSKLFQPVPSPVFNPENNLTARNLIQDDTGLIWSVSLSSNSLLCFDPKTEQFNTYIGTRGRLRKLSGSGVLSVYKDYSGILWVGAEWLGLNKWSKSNNKFKHFIYDSNGEHLNTVYKIIEDKKGIIWFGTNNGLYSFNRHSNKIKNYRYDPENISNSVYYIFLDEAGIIWCATFARGLVKFDRKNESFHFFSNDPNDTTSIGHNYATSIYPEGSDFLWVSTWRGGGLNKFDKKTGKFIRFKHNPDNPESLNDNDIFSLYKDKRDNLWIGTNKGGLDLYDRSTNAFKLFFMDEYGTNSVRSMYEDKKDNFWVGTYQTGLYLFDRDNQTPVYNISTKDGLPHNSVRSILEDDSGNLWISTDYGISKFNPETRQIRNYYTSDEFEQNRYWHNSACKLSTGEMLFGTYDGFIMFHPDSVKDDPVPPQLVISNVSLFNRPGEKLEFDGFISEMKELDLSYTENDLRFEYVGLQFADPSKNKYKYILEGHDKEWVDAGTQRNATYTNLDAGEYVFRVTACNVDGVWNNAGASIKIIIPPPFWATWWAYTIYILFGLGLLYSLRRYELNRTQLKNQVKFDEVKLKEREETDKMKSRFFANISHEFRTPLTLILGPSESIAAESKEEETKKKAGIIKRNANRLLALINQLLALSKLEAGKLELKTTKSNIVSFLKGITYSFESVAERKDITLKVKSLNTIIEMYFDKEKMTKIMTNLLSNAFKFTPEDGAITVSLFLITSPSERGMSGGQGEGEVQIKVRDSGIGISEEELPKLFDRFYQVDSSQTREHEGTGIGLALTKDLVELHHGTISVESKLGGWTEFTIELPLGRNHLKDEEITEEVTTEDVILNPDLVGMKNLIENNDADSSHFDNLPAGQAGLSVTENDNTMNGEKNIILIVEDNEDVREFIKDSLGSEFQIEEASNGETGLRRAKQIIPDLIISDIMMPQMDGNELTKRLKNDEKTSHIPIILLTAKSEQQSRLEGLEKGADEYLTKPFDTKELHVRINNLISIRRKLQEKYSSGYYRPGTRRDEKKLSDLDERFLSKVMEVIENNLSDEDFSIEQFGKEVGMSRMQLHRKLKALTGKSPSSYLRSIRLAKAKKMIEDKKGNISEIAYSVGFSSPTYFTRCYKEEFGHLPSELLN